MFFTAFGKMPIINEYIFLKNKKKNTLYNDFHYYYIFLVQ